MGANQHMSYRLSCRAVSLHNSHIEGGCNDQSVRNKGLKEEEVGKSVVCEWWRQQGLRRAAKAPEVGIIIDNAVARQEGDSAGKDHDAAHMQGERVLNSPEVIPPEPEIVGDFVGQQHPGQYLWQGVVDWSCECCSDVDKR